LLRRKQINGYETAVSGEVASQTMVDANR